MQEAVVPRDFPRVIEQLIWRPGQLKLRACIRCVAAEPDARRTPETTATTPTMTRKAAALRRMGKWLTTARLHNHVGAPSFQASLRNTGPVERPALRDDKQ
jgi:hypothetical protein